MKIIQAVSYNSANFMTSLYNQSHQKRAEYYYGFQFIYSGILKGALLVTISLLFHSLVPAIIIALVFASLRYFAGGVHMDTYAKCILITMLTFIPGSVLVKFLNPTELIIKIILVVTFVLTFIALIKFAPVDSPANQFSEKDKSKLKKLSLIVLVCWTIIAAGLNYIGYRFVTFSICLGLLIETSTVIPLFIKFYSNIDKLLTIGVKKND